MSLIALAACKDKSTPPEVPTIDVPAYMVELMARQPDQRTEEWCPSICGKGSIYLCPNGPQQRCCNCLNGKTFPHPVMQNFLEGS